MKQIIFYFITYDKIGVHCQSVSIEEINICLAIYKHDKQTNNNNDRRCFEHEEINLLTQSLYGKAPK